LNDWFKSSFVPFPQKLTNIHLDFNINRINPKTKINLYNFKMDRVKFEKIIKNYDFIIDGTDNFESKFLINDLSLK